MPWPIWLKFPEMLSSIDPYSDKHFKRIWSQSHIEPWMTQISLVCKKIVCKKNCKKIYDYFLLSKNFKNAMKPSSWKRLKLICLYLWSIFGHKFNLLYLSYPAPHKAMMCKGIKCEIMLPCFYFYIYN